jgi:alpha-D-ribose 1-methylphosphonate 5-triphosphate synthase subunit PhnI
MNLKVTSKQRRFGEEHRLPEEIKVGLVKVKLENGEIEVLITSLLGKEYTLEHFQ